LLTEEKIIEAYHAFGHELLVFLNRLTGSQDTSEDLLHDAFANLIAYSQKHDIENMRAFLYRSAHNIALNYIRKNRTTSYLENQKNGIPDNRDNIELKIENKELEQRIYELLHTADEITQSFFILRKENGLSLEEISRITGKSERTIRRKLKGITDYIYSTLQKEGLINEE